MNDEQRRQWRFVQGVVFLTSPIWFTILFFVVLSYIKGANESPELRTADGIAVTTCYKIRERGRDTGNVSDLAIDCTPTDESRRELGEWTKAELLKKK